MKELEEALAAQRSEAKKELEEALAAQRAESKKELDAATDSATARERGYADQLAALAQVVGGECFLPFDFMV